jgi:DNA-directed RNA polymerase III subunit RPC1
MTVQATLESHLNKTLSDVRDTVGNQCIEQLDPHNMPLVMAVCGSKGSHVNLSQMIGCLGQQTVGGKRISFGFT